MIGRGLFLSALPRELVPLKFLLPPIALALSTSFYARIASRYRQDRLIVALAVAVLVGSVLFWMALGTPFAGNFILLSLLYVFLDVSGALIIIQYWTLAGDLFDPREAKRLFGLISAGGTLAAILYGALLSALANYVSPRHLLFLFQANLLICIVSASAIGRRHKDALEPAPKTPRAADGKPRSGFGFLSSPMMTAMAGIVVAIAIASSITDFQLDLALQSAYGGNGAAIVSFLGSFRFWAGIVALAFQLFVAGRLLERFGIRVALLILPATILLGSVGVLFSGGLFLAVVFPRAADAVLKFTVNDSAFNLLYLPVPREVRARAKATLDGVVKPILLSLLALVFFFVTRHAKGFGVVHWSIPAIAMTGLWIALVAYAGRIYVAELAKTIRLRRFDVAELDFGTCEEATKVLLESLREENSLRVLHALSLIDNVANVDWGPHVVPLLQFPDREVKTAALGYLERLRDGRHAEAVRPLLSSEDPQVRGAAARAIGPLAGRQSIRELRRLLADDATEVRSQAIIGLIQSGGFDGLMHALEPLKRMIESDAEEDRIRAAGIIGELGIPTFQDPVHELLADESAAVRQAALEAARRLAAPELLGPAIDALKDSRTRAQAADAVDACMGEDFETIAPLLEAGRSEPAVREALAQLLGKRGSARAVELLAGLLEDPRASVRDAAVAALLVNRSNPLPEKIKGAALMRQLEKEIHDAYAWRRAQIACSDLASAVLLKEALDIRFSEARRRALSLTGLRHERIPIDEVTATLTGGDSRLQANSLELLDNLLPGEEKATLLPLFGGSPADLDKVAGKLLGAPRTSAGEALAALMRGDDEWVRAAALLAFWEHDRGSIGERLDAASGDEDPLVREVAGNLKNRLSPSGANGKEGESEMALSTIEKLLFLKGVSLFEKIPAEKLIGIVPIVKEERFDKDDFIIRKGEGGACLYIIVEGEASVRIDEKEVARFASKHIIGELAVLTEQPRTADCVALSETAALRIDKGDFWDLLGSRPEISVGIVRELVTRYVR